MLMSVPPSKWLKAWAVLLFAAFLGRLARSSVMCRFAAGVAPGRFPASNIAPASRSSSTLGVENSEKSGKLRARL